MLLSLCECVFNAGFYIVSDLRLFNSLFYSTQTQLVLLS